MKCKRMKKNIKRGLFILHELMQEEINHGRNKECGPGARRQSHT